MPIKLNKTLKILKQAFVAKQNFIKTLIKFFGCYTFFSSHSHGPSCNKNRYQCSFNLLPMLCLITYRRLSQGILLFHRYLLLYHPSVLPSLHEFLFNFQNRKYTQALLHCTLHKISFPRSLYLPKLDSGQESYVHFTSAMKSVLKFQNAQRSMFSP
jgi:hypothetical protein